MGLLDHYRFVSVQGCGVLRGVAGEAQDCAHILSDKPGFPFTGHHTEGQARRKGERREGGGGVLNNEGPVK